MKYIKNFLLFGIILLLIPLTTGCSDFNSTSEKDKTIGLGETFTFDDLEITLGNDITFTKIDNQFSDYNGQTVVKLPITVKNLKEETHSLNMFYFSIFGSSGTQLSTISSYFDDSIDFAGDLRSGASYTKYLYFLYDGDGTYDVEFSEVWGAKTTVEFNVAK